LVVSGGVDVVEFTFEVAKERNRLDLDEFGKETESGQLKMN